MGHWGVTGGLGGGEEQGQLWVWETGGREAGEKARVEAGVRVHRERMRPDQG